MRQLLAALLSVIASAAYAQTAPIQIHSLPTAAPITGNGTEWLPMDQGICPSCTFRVSPQALATYVLSQPFAINATNITQGTLPCAQLPSFSGAFSSNGCVVSFSGIVPVINGGTGTATPSLVAGANVAITGTWPFQTISSSSVSSVALTSPDGSLGITGSPSAALTAIVNASNISTGILSLAHGGTGTATPGLVAGANVTISGSWPNQTVSTSGSLTEVSFTSSDGSLSVTGSPGASIFATVNATDISAGILPLAHGGTGTATAAIVPGTNVTVSGSWPNQTINSVTNVALTSPDGSLGVTGSPSAALTATVNASNIAVGILPIARGGTGTGSPGLVAGSSISITGSWPNQTINSTALTNVALTSPDNSITVTGSPGSTLTAAVNASNITTGTVPATALPALTGNVVQMVQAIGNVSSMCGLPFIDGVNGVDLNVVLLGHQTTASQNGPWQMHAGSCPGSGNWTRPAWFQSGSSTQAVNNMSVLVAQGTNYQGSTWTLQFAPTPVIIDTTSQSWFVVYPKSLALNGGSVGRNQSQRAGDAAHVQEFYPTNTSWSGTIRHDYGNSNAIAGISCTQNSTTIGLAGVTIPSNYNGGGAEIPQCGNPGAENSSNPGNPAQSFTFSSAGTGFWPKQILAVTGGTNTIPAWAIIYTTALQGLPAIASGGTCPVNGTFTFTATTGVTTGTSSTNYPTFVGTISGNTLTSLASYAAPAAYYENPIVINAEPVTGGSCSVPPTLDFSAVMGANTGSVYQNGNYTAIPSNPVSFAPAALPANALTWASGTATFTIATYMQGSASVLPGFFLPNWTTGTSQFPVTISNASPSGFNGTYTATVTGPTTFTFPLASNPGGNCPSTCPALYTVAPSASGAQANLSWSGNPLVGTISNIVNSGGNATFTISNAANSTITNGSGKAYLWLSGADDTAAITNAAASGSQALIFDNPPVVPGWESCYMISSVIALGGIHRWDVDGMGGCITGAKNAGSPVSGAMIQINTASQFRDQSASTLLRLDLDAAGGFTRNLTNTDWDWIICQDKFENATNLNEAWSYGGHSRESFLCSFHIINDGYSPLNYPVEGIDSEAPDTRISDGLILQGFQQTAIFNDAGTGDVNFTNFHAEAVVGGPTVTERGTGNRWLGGNQTDLPPPGFPGYAVYGSYNNFQNSDTLDATLGIVSYGAHNVFANNRFGGSTPALLACIDMAGGGLSTNMEKNIWTGNVGCPPIPIGLPTFTVATLPTCSGFMDTNAIAAVTDAVSPTYNGALTGGGTTKIPVFCNGSAWVAH